MDEAKKKNSPLVSKLAQLSRSKRERKSANYKETSDNDDDVAKESDDEDFMNVKNSKSKRKNNRDDIPLNNSPIKTTASKLSGIEKSDNDVCFKSSFANIVRPNLSEGESSESSDEDDHALKYETEKGSHKSCNETKACNSDGGKLENSTKNSDQLQPIGSDNDGIVKSSDKTKKSVETEIEFTKSSPEGKDKSDELGKGKERKRIKFEDEVVKDVDNKLPLSTKSSPGKNSAANVCTVLSPERNRNDGNREELDEIQVKALGKKSKKLSLSSKLSDKRAKSAIISTKKEGKEIVKSLPETVKMDTEGASEEIEIENKRKGIKLEDGVGTNGKLSLSAKLSSKKKNLAREPVVISSGSNESNGSDEDVKIIKHTKMKRKKGDKGIKDTKMSLSTKLSQKRRKKDIMASSFTSSDGEEAETKPTKKKKRKKGPIIDQNKSLSAQRSKSTERDDLSHEADRPSSGGSESDGNWEDVGEVKTKTKKATKEEEKNLGPITGLEVSVEVDSIHAKKKKKGKEEKMDTWVRQMFQRVKKNSQILLHKTHLLCLFAHALNQNKCCNEDTLKGIFLSMIPIEHLQRMPNKWDIIHLRRFTIWFQKEIPEVQDLLMYIDKEAKLLDKFKLQRIHVFVIMLRSLGFLCRTIYSFIPITAKVKKSELKTLKIEDKSVSSDDTLSSQKEVKCTKTKIRSPSSPYYSNEDERDKDFVAKSKIKSPASVKKATKKPCKSDKAGSSSSSSSSTTTDLENACTLWSEIYMETLKRWICLELLSESINSPSKCEAAAAKPLQYVIGIDNNQKVKDVTCRYAQNWLTKNRKLRVDRDWWAKTLDPYKPNDSIIDSSEDAQLRSDQMHKDLPKTISEFKGHPLYALQRHLLKYEAIYPETMVPVGYINKEAIYPRECVHVLQTQQAWLKQGRCLKPGEEPYKMVKGRKRFTDRHLGTEVLNSCFGIWQTELYVPPPVIDGKVPKNEYGNVELFQPWMLPEGAVHIPMSDMHMLARKLDIDYAKAMMGWDFHSGFSHPIFEGIIVAKEYEDILLDAWNKHQEEVDKKEKLKREQAIFVNWRKLIKGVLIAARLRDKYSFEDEQDDKMEKCSSKANNKVAVQSKVEKITEVTDKDDNEEDINSMSEYWPNNQTKPNM